MAKESGTGREKDTLDTLGKKAGKDYGEVAGRFAYVREDGAVCFGDECVVLKAQDDGKLRMSIKPSKCGDETGKVILDYLIKTAGKGVVIEIPSEVEESK